MEYVWRTVHHITSEHGDSHQSHLALRCWTIRAAACVRGGAAARRLRGAQHRVRLESALRRSMHAEVSGVRIVLGEVLAAPAGCDGVGRAPPVHFEQTRSMPHNELQFTSVTCRA